MSGFLPRNIAWRLAVIIFAAWIQLAGILCPVAAMPPAQANVIDPEGALGPGVDPDQAHAETQSTDPLLFSEDFEAYGDSSRWNRSFPFSVQQEFVADGSYAARLTNAGGKPEFGRKRLDEPQKVLFVRLQFRMLTLGAHPVTLVQLRSSDTSSIVSVQLTPDGMITYVTGATGITSTGALGAQDEAWNTLHVMVDTTRSEQNIRIWLNEIELTSMRQDAWLGESPIRMLEIGDNTSSRFSDIAIDNVLVDDTFIPSTRLADPVSGVLTVRASVPWEGITFELDDRQFTTDQSGVARIEVERWTPDLRRRIIVHTAARDEFQASFIGWHDWISAHSNDVYAAFNILQPISFTFVDMFDAPVDVSIIDEVTIKSSIGEIYTLHASDLSGPILLISSVASSPTGLHSKAITYYVDEVLIDGANVVNRSQQRTTFDSSQEWRISLLFFGVRFQAVDALFGTPLGEELLVRAPDGTEQRIPLDEHGIATIPRLPRGDYQVSVIGGGYSPPRPIRVSRDQVVQLDVISQRDAVVFGAVAATVVTGLVLAGRPFIVTTPMSFLRNALAAPRREAEGRGQP